MTFIILSLDNFLSWHPNSARKSTAKSNNTSLLSVRILPSVLWHCWFGSASRRAILSDEALVWLSVWSKVQIVCIWSSWWHCIPKTPSSLASFKSRLVVRYDTIRDAILTCARKPTWVGLIYRTEPTTKKCKTEKLKTKKPICSEVTVNSLGNPYSQSWRRKGKLRGKDLQKRKVLSLEWKSEGVIEYYPHKRRHSRWKLSQELKWKYAAFSAKYTCENGQS